MARSKEELEEWTRLRREGYTYLAIAAGAGVSESTVWAEMRKLHGPGGGQPPNSGNTCRNGHERNEKNVYWQPDGTRSCRVCRAATARALYKRRKGPTCKAT